MKYKILELGKHDYVVLKNDGKEKMGAQIVFNKVFWNSVNGSFADEIQHFFFRSSAFRLAKRLVRKDLKRGKIIWSSDEEV